MERASPTVTTVKPASAPTNLTTAAVAVDVALLTVRAGRLQVLLQRPDAPGTEDLWALPGGRVLDQENLDAAARRILRDWGAVHEPAHLEQVRTYGEPNRDPRSRVVSVSYLALTPAPQDPPATTRETRFTDVSEVVDRSLALAFDHDRLVADALERARGKLEYRPIAASFVGEPFTLGELREVYETVWGVALDPANFRRKVTSTEGFVVPTGEKSSPGAGGGRPATLYRRGPAERLHPAMLRT
ncbi:MAG: 8-oxo-dGTP diphosphatase [Glaciecola sp.]